MKTKTIFLTATILCLQTLSKAQIKMRAVEYVHLKEGFSVPDGSSLEILTTTCNNQ